MHNPAPPQSWQIVVMGVSGCGKTTMANELAQRLNLRMVDGDDLHHPESVAKMRAGIALQDEDRWPWLDRIGQTLTETDPQNCGRVVACSALKRAYRDRIRQQAAQVCFVFLDGTPELIRQRMLQRVGHYMPPQLLSSQLQTLERPGADESDVLRLDIDACVPALGDRAVQALHQWQANKPHTPA